MMPETSSPAKPMKDSNKMKKPAHQYQYIYLLCSNLLQPAEQYLKSDIYL